MRKFDKIIPVILGMLICLLAISVLQSPDYFGVGLLGYLIGFTLAYVPLNHFIRSYSDLCYKMLGSMRKREEKIDLLEMQNYFLRANCKRANAPVVKKQLPKKKKKLSRICKKKGCNMYALTGKKKCRWHN